MDGTVPSGPAPGRQPITESDHLALLALAESTEYYIVHDNYVYVLAGRTAKEGKGYRHLSIVPTVLDVPLWRHPQAVRVKYWPNGALEEIGLESYHGHWEKLWAACYRVPASMPLKITLKFRDSAKPSHNWDERIYIINGEKVKYPQYAAAVRAMLRAASQSQERQDDGLSR